MLVPGCVTATPRGWTQPGAYYLETRIATVFEVFVLPSVQFIQRRNITSYENVF